MIAKAASILAEALAVTLQGYWTGTVEDKTRPVSISPLIMSGKLVITGTRIPVEDVVQRASEGETVASLAKDYRLSTDSIVEAMRHLVPQAA